MPIFHQKGYAYEPERKESRPRRLSRETYFIHHIIKPDGEKIQMPFGRLINHDAFRSWVSMVTGDFKREYNGYQYDVQCRYGWHRTQQNWFHVVTTPDGRTIHADFKSTWIASEQIFRLYIDFGLPSPKDFGRKFLSLKLFSDAEKIVQEFNVDRTDHTSLAMLMKLSG